MPGIYLDFSPAYLYTGNGEPESIPIENRLAIELRNLSLEEPAVLKNDDQTEHNELPSYEEACIQEGLSCIYLRFDLGTEDDCLTDEAAFTAAFFAQPQDWRCCRKHHDTIILYPAHTLSLEPSESVEFILDRLCTRIPGDTFAACHIKYVNVTEGVIQETTAVFYKKRCPLGIRRFLPEAEDVTAGFGDKVRLKWCVTGADEVILQPGGIILEKEGVRQIILTGKERYNLTACCDGRQVSQSILLEPLTASIENFTIKEASDREITLAWKVSNTRHVYLPGKGRLFAGNGGAGSVTMVRNKKISSYTLTVENQEGLIQSTVYTGSLPGH